MLESQRTEHIIIKFDKSIYINTPLESEFLEYKIRCTIIEVTAVKIHCHTVINR